MNKHIVKALIIGSILVSGISNTINVHAIQDGYTTQRLGGKDRYATAIEISKEFSKNETIENVILGTDNNYADSISCTPLSVYLNAPILLTGKNSLNQDTQKQLAALKAKNVYIIGGTGVISATVENQLIKLGYKVKRLGGADRYETNKIIMNEIPKELWGPRPKVINGYDWVQGLSVAVDTKYFDPIDGKIYINPLFVISATASTYDDVKDVAATLAPVQGTWESRETGIYEAYLDENLFQNIYNRIPAEEKTGEGIEKYESEVKKPFGNINIIVTNYNRKSTMANITINTGFADLIFHVGNIPYKIDGALLTRQDNFIDSLSVSALSAKYAMPIVMANKSANSVYQAVFGRDMLSSTKRSNFLEVYDNVNKVFYIGGSVAVPDGCESFLNGV